MDDVIKFFEHYHPSQAKIYNLCIEDDRQYEVENFSGQVASFPFYDHNCPPLALIPAFCNSAYTWLNEGPDHVVAVHCKAGKSRTGLMVCCLLLHIKEQRELDECIRFYGFRRCYDGQGVTIPSQRRYINYYRTLLAANEALPKPHKQPALPQKRKMRIVGLQLFDVPAKVVKEQNALEFAFLDHYSLGDGPNLYESWSSVGGIGGGHNAENLMEQTGAAADLDSAATGTATGVGADAAERFSRVVQSMSYALDVSVDEDFKLMMYTSDDKGKRHKLFYIWANTCFMPEPAAPGKPVKLVCYRDQCDKFKGKKKWAKTFRVEISLVDDGPTDRFATSELSAEEACLRSVKLEHYDPWVLADVKAAQLAAMQDKKKDKKKHGSDDEDGEEDETYEEAAAALEAMLNTNRDYVQAVTSAAVNFVERAVVGSPLPNIAAKKDWGTYNIEQLRLTGVAMDPDCLGIDRSRSHLTIMLNSIVGRFEGFQWIFDRVKMPKASDSCTADAEVVFRVVCATPIFVLSGDQAGEPTAAASSTGGAAAAACEGTSAVRAYATGKTTVTVEVENLSLEVRGGKHPWMYRRLNAAFEANIRESVQQALQDCALSTKATNDLAARITAATDVLNRTLQEAPARAAAA